MREPRVKNEVNIPSVKDQFLKGTRIRNLIFFISIPRMVKPLTLDRLRERIEGTGEKLIVPDGFIYQNKKTALKVLCQCCEEIYDIKWNDFSKGTRCPCQTIERKSIPKKKRDCTAENSEKMVVEIEEKGY